MARAPGSKTASFPLRLLASLKAEAERLAAAEGTSLNQFINAAVAEKIGALRTADYFRERARHADDEAFRRVLAKAGNEPPRPGDEPPEPGDAADAGTDRVSGKPAHHRSGGVRRRA